MTEKIRELVSARDEKYYFEEAGLNQLGYTLLENNQTQEAVTDSGNIY